MAHFPIEYAEVDLLYRRTVGQGLGVIAITSAETGEGRTTLSRTLARRAAAAGQKTLLIDLNIANAQLHDLYDIERLDWYPQQDAPLPIQATQADCLYVLTAPQQGANRWEFRDIASVLACLNDLRKSYELIVIDTSPLSKRNQGNVPPETLCTCADGTLLCAMTGRTSETKIREVAELLQSVNANLHGAVLNDRFAPNLVSELIRETHRFNRFLPKLMEKLRNFLRNSTLLNQDI